jgi:hypothetical protein
VFDFVNLCLPSGGWPGSGIQRPSLCRLAGQRREQGRVIRAIGGMAVFNRESAALPFDDVIRETTIEAREVTACYPC